MPVDRQFDLYEGDSEGQMRGRGGAVRLLAKITRTWLARLGLVREGEGEGEIGRDDGFESCRKRKGKRFWEIEKKVREVREFSHNNKKRRAPPGKRLGVKMLFSWIPRR